MFVSEWRWISFGALPCGGGKNLLTARVSVLLKSRASLTCFRACFLPGRAKDLSAPGIRTVYFRWDIAVVLTVAQLSAQCSQTQRIHIYVATRCFCIACLNNYMFRPLYRPSSGCTLSYYKANYTICTAFVFVDEFSCTTIKFAFKIITVTVELKSYSNVEGVINVKIWVL